MKGLEGLNAFLKSEGLPTGEPQLFPTGDGSAEVSRPADGGKVAGVGKVSGESSGGKAGGEVGAPSVSQEKLSPDDDTVESQLDAGEPHELAKGAHARLSRQEMDQTVARKRAAMEARLRKGEEDIEHGVGIAPPQREVQKGQEATVWNQGADSMFRYDDQLDLRAEQMLKSDALYQGPSPQLSLQKTAPTSATLCKSCDSPFSMMLTACPHCGAGCTGHPLAKSGNGETMVFEQGRPGPVLRKSREEADLVLPRGTIVTE